MVDRDPPAGDRDPGLPGGDERRLQAARARRRVELQRHRHLADRAVRADGVHDAHVRPLAGPAGTLRPGGAARRSRSSTPAARGRRGELRVLGEHRVQPRLDVHARPRSPPAAPRATRRSARRRTARRRSRARSRRARPRRRRRATIGTARRAYGHDVGRDAARPRSASTTRDDLARRRSAGSRARSWRADSAKRPPVNSASRSATGRLHAQARAARTARAGRPRSPSPVNGCEEISRCPSRSM